VNPLKQVFPGGVGKEEVMGNEDSSRSEFVDAYSDPAEHGVLELEIPWQYKSSKKNMYVSFVSI